MTSVTDIDIAAFNYALPDERIARHPLLQRDSCKLLLRTHDGLISDHTFSSLPELLPADSMLIGNNTRVINARLLMHKSTGAAIEVFILEPHFPADYQQAFATTDSCEWTCFVGNSKRWRPGQQLIMVVPLPSGDRVNLIAERVSREDAASVVRFSWHTESGQPVTFSQIIEVAGVIPIPPYLNRESEATDNTDYQTVYSRIEGSVAAPTAGLHFTPELFDSIRSRGIPVDYLTLHVGAGTFKPVTAEHIGDHAMHSEFISVPRCVIEALATTERQPIAIGTTSVRTLESLYHFGCMAGAGELGSADDIPQLEQWYPYSPSHPNLSTAEALTALLNWMDAGELDTLEASTRIIIAPGYRYRIVRGMITNFHQPQSTLLLLVSAFIGDDWKRVYEHALDAGYRFLSYGDACLFL